MDSLRSQMDDAVQDKEHLAARLLDFETKVVALQQERQELLSECSGVARRMSRPLCSFYHAVGFDAACFVWTFLC